MGLFSKAKDMYALQKEAKAVKKQLKSIHVEAESDGVTLVITGEQEIVSISFSPDLWADVKDKEYGKKKLEDAVKKAFEKGMKKSQEIAAQKMKGVWEQMGVAQK